MLKSNTGGWFCEGTLRIGPFQPLDGGSIAHRECYAFVFYLIESPVTTLTQTSIPIVPSRLATHFSNQRGLRSCRTKAIKVSYILSSQDNAPVLAPEWQTPPGDSAQVHLNGKQM